MWSQISPTELRLEFRSTRYSTRQQVHRLQRITGSGVLLVPECGAGYRETTVPMLTDKKPASNPVLTTGSPVTEVYRL